MIRVEVIPPEFDLSRPVKRRESAAASRDSIDIFTGKNQRLKSRYRRVDPRSIVGQRGSVTRTKPIFESSNGGNTISVFA